MLSSACAHQQERQGFFDQLAEERLEPGTSLEYLVGVFLLRGPERRQNLSASQSPGLCRRNARLRSSPRIFVVRRCFQTVHYDPHVPARSLRARIRATPSR